MARRRLRGVIWDIQPISGRGPKTEPDDFGGPDVIIQGTEIAPQRSAREIKADQDAIRTHNQRELLKLLPQRVVPEYAKPKSAPAPKHVLHDKAGNPIAEITLPPKPTKPFRRV